MRKCKHLLMTFAIAACALAFTMEASAATHAVELLKDASVSAMFSGHGMSILGIGSVALAGTKSRFFRVALEGATTDGRNILREWITQMAANYSTVKYGARVNLEHLRGILPDGPFRAYGDVLALEAREETGELAGKMGLYAQISPTDDLVTMTKKRQKIYTSIEINPKFADTDQAYMIGLAVTDSPASLGTEILAFSAQHPEANPFTSRKAAPTNLFSAASEANIEFETAEPSVGTNFLASITELLGLGKRKDVADSARFADMEKATQTIAKFSASQGDIITAHSTRIDSLTRSVETLSDTVKKSGEAYAALTATLEKTDGGKTFRPTTTGGGNAPQTTDC